MLVPNNFNIANGQFRLTSEVVKESYKPAIVSPYIKTDQKGNITIVTAGKAVLTLIKRKVL